MTKSTELADAAVPYQQASISTFGDDDLLDIDAVCRYFGGSKPLHPATIYRGVAAGRYPRPVRPSPNVTRWVGSELKAAKQAIIDAPRAAPAGADTAVH